MFRYSCRLISHIIFACTDMKSEEFIPICPGERSLGISVLGLLPPTGSVSVEYGCTDHPYEVAPQENGKERIRCPWGAHDYISPADLEDSGKYPQKHNHECSIWQIQ